MRSFKNLVFDLDGTLVDSSEGVIEAVNYSLKQLGEPSQPPEAIKPFIGYPLEKMYPNFTDAPIDKLLEHFQERAAQTVISSTRVLPGVEIAIRELRSRGYRLAIATTKIKPHVIGILEKFGWSQLFETSAGSDEVEQVKPDPSILHLVLRRLDARASETMMIGDTVNDVLAARAIPMTVTAVASLYGERQKLLASQPDYFIEQLGDLSGILDHGPENV
ncbi:MAG: HAD-IA family hydrolase [candidate division Zixibacteria bacterium]|nr:HAD-IA family hydrolase [candidate division Zixibacteria bacterium]